MSKPILEVMNHHMTCLARGDVDGIMEDYTDRSILFSTDGVLEGKADIRTFFTNLTGAILPSGTNFRMVRQDVRGDTVFLNWQADTHALRVHLGVETLVIRDGKIATHTFAAAIEPKE